MKKTKILLLSLFVLFVSVACAEDDKRIATSELPTAAQQFIKKYFAKKKLFIETCCPYNFASGAFVVGKLTF